MSDSSISACSKMCQFDAVVGTAVRSAVNVPTYQPSQLFSEDIDKCTHLDKI